MTNAFLLTYNPTRWHWAERDTVLEGIRASGDEGYLYRWSAGPHPSRIAPGDEAYLLRQGPEPRGIVAAGVVVSEVVQDRHWDGKQGVTHYVEVRWESAVPADDPLPLAALKEVAPQQNWHPRAGGSLVRAEVANAVADVWRDHVAATS